jgi:hypothetical protein
MNEGMKQALSRGGRKEGKKRTFLCDGKKVREETVSRKHVGEKKTAGKREPDWKKRGDENQGEVWNRKCTKKKETYVLCHQCLYIIFKFHLL